MGISLGPFLGALYAFSGTVICRYHTNANYIVIIFLAASEAGYDDVSEPEDGLISNEDDTADLVNRTRAELGHAIRNPEQTSHRNGKLPLKATVTVKAVLPAIILID